jgi:hypothetical protein
MKKLAQVIILTLLFSSRVKADTLVVFNDEEFGYPVISVWCADTGIIDILDLMCEGNSEILKLFKSVEFGEGVYEISLDGKITFKSSELGEYLKVISKNLKLVRSILRK